MVELTPINELEVIAEQATKEKDLVPNSDISTLTKQEITKAYESGNEQLSADKTFQEATKAVVNRSAQVQLEEDMLAIMTKEHQNQYSQYLLENEKKKLAFKRKKEEKLILEEVKAEVANKRTETLKKRYGYMYKENEAFIPSKLYNKNREFTNWWNGTSDTFRSFVKGTLKFLFYGAIAFLVGFLGYKGIKWIVVNTSLPNVSTASIINKIIK